MEILQAMFIFIVLICAIFVLKSTSLKSTQILKYKNKVKSYSNNNRVLHAFSQDNHLYLGRMVERKKIVVDNMLRRHQDPSDPLVMRMTYMATECKYNVTRSLKKPGFGKENLHAMSVVVDLKRYSPTVPDKRQIVEYSSAKQFAELLVRLHSIPRTI